MNSHALLAEAALRAACPLQAAYASATPDQARFIESQARESIAEGGNQSGKTRSLIIKTLRSALGFSPSRNPEAKEWKGWYSTTSYKAFSGQHWFHFKNLLLFPGESELKLPTRRIQQIGWDTKNPQIPNYLLLRRKDGKPAHLWIKSYEQGAGEYQAAEVDFLALDEECPNAIYDEAQPRVLRRNGQLGVAATPVIGVPWLAQLRVDAEAGEKDVFHTRLKTTDNPSLNPEALDAITKRLAHHPALRKLRLEGIPMAMEGSVYNDLLFTSAHVRDPASIPANWAHYLSIDHGWRNTAALWFAVSPKESSIILYEEYLGQERTIGQNAAEIWQRCQGKRLCGAYIDPATLGTESNSGKRIIDLYNESFEALAAGRSIPAAEDAASSVRRAVGATGLPSVAGQTGAPSPHQSRRLILQPATRGEVMAGIHAVWELLAERVEVPAALAAAERAPARSLCLPPPSGGGPGPAFRPRFQVFRSCVEFLRERREYRFPDAREKGPEAPEKPVKRGDHLMDAWRYMVTTGLRYAAPPAAPPPPEGSIGRKFYDARHPKPKARL